MKIFAILLILSTQVLAGPGGVGGGNGNGPVIGKREIQVSPTKRYKLSDIESAMLANGKIVRGAEIEKALQMGLEFIDIQLKSGQIIVIQR